MFSYLKVVDWLFPSLEGGRLDLSVYFKAILMSSPLSILDGSLEAEL